MLNQVFIYGIDSQAVLGIWQIFSPICLAPLNIAFELLLNDTEHLLVQLQDLLSVMHFEALRASHYYSFEVLRSPNCSQRSAAPVLMLNSSHTNQPLPGLAYGQYGHLRVAEFFADKPVCLEYPFSP